MIVLYRKTVFSAMLRWLYPEDVCHSHRSSVPSLMGRFVDRLGVIRTVCRKRRNWIKNLLKQGRDLGAIMRPTSGQIRCDDLPCVSIDSEVQLPPSPAPRRFLHMTDVNPESCTIDEQVDRPIRS
jgi:hypothetical protein